MDIRYAISARGEFHDIPLIVEVTLDDLLINDAVLSRRLFINEGDIPRFRTSAQERISRGERVFLTRFAVTEYRTYLAKTRTGLLNLQVHYDAYIAQLTAFLDFNVIDLTFERNGTERVIPVVHDPLDIIAGLSPPSNWRPTPNRDNCPWWHAVLGWILLAVLAIATLVLIVKVLFALLTGKWERFFVMLAIVAALWITLLVMGLLNVGGLCGMWDVVLFWRQM